jgi:hypothetical protein
MITLVLFTLAGLALAALVWRGVYDNFGYDSKSPIAATVLAVLILGAMFGAFMGVSSIITYNTANLTPVLTHEYPLRALDTGSDSHGSLFLGSGYFESGPAYTYLSEREDGGFEMGSVYTQNAIVYQVDNEQPRRLVGQVRPTSMLWSIVPALAKTEFYVPAGSVQEPTYRVDVNR